MWFNYHILHNSLIKYPLKVEHMMVNNAREANTSMLEMIVSLANITVDRALHLTEDKSVFKTPGNAKELNKFNERTDQIITSALRKKFNI